MTSTITKGERTWHGPEHKRGIRQRTLEAVVAELLKMESRARPKNRATPSDKFLKQIFPIARLVENTLYCAAESLAVYSDTKTLAGRVKRVIAKRQAQQRIRRRLRERQRSRILRLRHASKCKCGKTDESRVCGFKDCAQYKILVAHLSTCKDPNCATPHCYSSRYVLTHYSKCKHKECEVCGPVRDAI